MSVWAFVKDPIKVGLSVSEQTSCLGDFSSGELLLQRIFIAPGVSARG